MTTVINKWIRKTKTSRLSSLSPSPSKIRQTLQPAEDAEITSELTDDPVTIHESVTVQESPSPVVTVSPIPVSFAPVLETVVVTLPVSLTPLLPGIVAQKCSLVVQ